MRTVVLEIVRGGAATLLGLYAGGVFFAVIAPSVGRLPGPVYVPYWKALNTDYGRVMPPFLLTCLALLVATCALSYGRGRTAFWLSVAATVLVLATIVLTVTQMEPLNRLVDGWSPDDAPADFAAVRGRWLALHTVRTVLAVLAFVSLLTAQGTDRPKPPHARPATAVVGVGVAR
ncbi:anthrone oxygenase family protein [Streptomyces sp. NPDC088733]|uniref:anthrone oxygenase family protein n=1 Tax=Streptomyces sp. NPDC088733 TaxID=3365880 RepID=UPI0037FA446E